MNAMSILCAVVAFGFAAGPALSCTPAELAQKQRAMQAAAKAAFERDPGGDANRQAQVQQIIERYAGLSKSGGGQYVIDMICRENEEFLSIYR
jgi:hypothetical protein